MLVIGSGFGFSVVCLALGLKDNSKGRLTFVDPSFDVLKHGPWKTFGGRGTWDKPEEVTERFRIFGVDEIITHYKLTTEEFFPDSRPLASQKSISHSWMATIPTRMSDMTS